MPRRSKTNNSCKFPVSGNKHQYIATNANSWTSCSPALSSAAGRSRH
uniref:Uncharacterized protein n=1 Tax=Arundo donax TaxID=35708 RepID=A0A0A9FSN3_ARUDO